MTVTRTIELADITPSELAELFCEMDSAEQAQFFAGIKPITDKWPGAGWCQQSCSIACDLNKDGREIIEKLAEHVLGYDELVEALQDFQQHVIRHSCVWDDAENGSHHHPIWAKVSGVIARALNGQPVRETV